MRLRSRVAVAWLLLAVAIAACAMLAWRSAAAGPPSAVLPENEPFTPTDANFVVLRVPRGVSSVADAPKTANEASARAADLIESARLTREPRLLGRAEALLTPWLAVGSPHVEVRLVQASLLQKRHDFDAALSLLDGVIADAPSSAQARLQRASIHFVRGEFARAQTDCASLTLLGSVDAGAACLATALAGRGRLDAAETLLRTVLQRQDDSTSDRRMVAWMRASLGDVLERRGDASGAEKAFRDALSADLQDESVRCALADVLLARGDADEALEWLDLPRPTLALLVRKAQAETIREGQPSRDTKDRIDELSTLEAARGEGLHQREQALWSLLQELPAAESLRWARDNFAQQREPIDLRLFARASVAARDRASLTELETWLRATGYQDAVLTAILSARPLGAGA